MAVAVAVLGASCTGETSQTAAGPSTPADLSTPTAPVPGSTGKASMSRAAALRRRPVRHRRYDGPVIAIGDSVMLDAAPALRERLPAIEIDASTDRAVETGITALETKVWRDSRQGPIVFHLGNNSSFSRRQVAHILQVAAGRRVVLVTDHCPYCSWVPADNFVIHAFCTPAVRCFVADWESLANAHPAWFGSDRVHMPIGGAGARAYAQLVVDAIYAP